MTQTVSITNGYLLFVIDRRSKERWECDTRSVNRPLIDSDPQNLLRITLDVPLQELQKR